MGRGLVFFLLLCAFAVASHACIHDMLLANRAWDVVHGVPQQYAPVNTTSPRGRALGGTSWQPLRISPIYVGFNVRRSVACCCCCCCCARASVCACVRPYLLSRRRVSAARGGVLVWACVAVKSGLISQPLNLARAVGGSHSQYAGSNKADARLGDLFWTGGARCFGDACAGLIRS
jgi:hypothetical protein